VKKNTQMVEYNLKHTIPLILSALLLMPLARVYAADAPMPAGKPVFRDYVDYVRPWIGSKTGRWFQTVSGCRPFGMAGITPDTELGSRYSGCGYVYQKPNIFGFSHLHGWGLGGILVMPTVGGVAPAQGPGGWNSVHQHSNEVMTAGYHKVLLDRYGITAEITSTARAGFHRWTFANDGAADIFFDLHSELSEADQVDAEVTKVSDTEIEGWVRLHANCEFAGGDVGKVYFVARFSKPFASLRAWKNADLGSVSSAAGHLLVVYPRFPVKRGEVLAMKIGLSFCGTGQARKNLDSEIGTRDFQAIRDESRAEWNEWLGKARSPVELKNNASSSTPTCGTPSSDARPSTTWTARTTTG